MKSIKGRRINGPAAPATGAAPKFWNVASVSDDEGIITLYGDVMSSQPIDWWTGEPVPGMFITPEGFMDDIAAVKDKARITVKINSCGGDLYTGIAIHNAIKGLGKDVTVVVEGIAASAASVIMCAGKTVQVWPGSIVMIHGVSVGLMDYYTTGDLKKVLKANEAAERAVAEIYAAKTGKDSSALLGAMEREKWMTGREAVTEGFADELLEGEGGPEAQLVGRDLLMIAGVKHDITGFHIPASMKIKSISPAAPARAARAAEINKPAKAGKTEGEPTMPYASIEELRTAQPDLVQQIEAAAAAEAITAERTRLHGIEEIAASVGDEELVRDAKYGEKPCTAADLALRAMQKQAKLGTDHLDAKGRDNAASGVQEVKSMEGKDDDKPMTKAERMAAGRADAKAATKKKED